MNSRMFIASCSLLMTWSSESNADNVHYIANSAAKNSAWEMRVDYNSRLSFRLGAHNRELQLQREKAFFKHSASLHNKAITALWDWHPLASQFRVTGGLFIASPELHVFSEPAIDWDTVAVKLEKSLAKSQRSFNAESIDSKAINSNQRRYISEKVADIDTNALANKIIAEVRHIDIGREDINLAGRLKYGSVAPYFGIGWANRPGSKYKLRFSVDVGLMFAGDPKMDMVMNGRVLHVDPRLTAELNNEFDDAVQRLQAKSRGYGVLPSASIGLSMVF